MSIKQQTKCLLSKNASVKICTQQNWFKKRFKEVKKHKSRKLIEQRSVLKQIFIKTQFFFDIKHFVKPLTKKVRLCQNIFKIKI